MKINKLLESSTPTSDASNITTSAPKFGRDDKTLEETTAGSIATVASPVGKVRSRGSIFSGIKTSEKFPNTVDEDLADEGMFGIGGNKSQQKTPLDYKAVRQMSQQKGPNQKFYRPDEYVKQYGAFAEEQLDEVDPRNFDSDEDYYAAVRNQGKQKFSGDWDVWDEIASLENQLKYTKSSALAHTLHKQIDQLKSEYGIEDDEQLDEKSVSKAQFRTMAAVAHNPKFAKKVGISQKVGKEFHKADRKQDYKDLPAKVDEEGKGLWANIHAKRERIKSGSGERMRKPGSKGAPTAQNFKDAANEAANPAQQAAIAIAKKKKQGMAEGATPASTSKVLRLIQRHRPDWFDNYGMGEVEDTVVDMAEMGKFQGMSAVDALALVGQELESLYGQQGMAEGYDTAEDYRAKAQWLMRTHHLRPDEAMEYAYYDTDPATWEGSPWEDDYKQGMSEEKQRLDPKCWTGYKKQGTKMKGDTRVNNCVPIEEAELNEEDMLANELFKQLELFKKAQDKGIGSKPQDKGISTKAKDRDIISKGNPEYDDEAGMADNNLETLRRAVEGIDELINAGDNLPEWCQEKIAVAKGMLVGVWDYMKSEQDRDEVTEEFDLIESIIENLAIRNNVDSEMIWEDLESLTDDELYVFAVTSEPINEDWQKVNKKDKTDGMSPKAVKAYRRENPGSKLKTAVTTKPSKLKKGSKASKRRKSYCSRSRGQMKMHNISCSKTPDKAICKARRRWNC